MHVTPEVAAGLYSEVRTLLASTCMAGSWIPACAESAPRIEKKYSGGNDGYKRDSRLRLERPLH